MSLEIKFPKILHFEDSIYLSRSSDDNTVSQIFYLAGENISLQITTGLTAGLTAQGCNISPRESSFTSDSSWYNIENITSPYTVLVDNQARFIRIKCSFDLDADFRCYLFSYRTMGPIVT